MQQEEGRISAMKKKTCVFLMVAIIGLMVMVAPLSASDTDDRIVSSAKDSYIWKTALKDDDISITAKDGVVTLTGVVSRGSHRVLAVDVVERLPMVKRVDNKLTVKGAKSTKDKDVEIYENVQATLLFHRGTRDMEPTVSVKDGKVILSGNAASRAQKDLATEYAYDVDGVADVDNQMTVYSDQTTVEKVTGYVDDASISAQVRYALMIHRSTSVIKTRVDTVNGEVTLQGKAKNQAEISLVNKLVSGINGVTSIKNQMTIE
jgi:osmotically-inducible protein OsmY